MTINIDDLDDPRTETERALDAEFGRQVEAMAGASLAEGFCIRVVAGSFMAAALHVALRGCDGAATAKWLRGLADRVEQLPVAATPMGEA